MKIQRQIIKKNKKRLKNLQPHKKPVTNFSTEIIPWIMLIITFPCLYIFKFSGGGWPPSLLQEKICPPTPSLLKGVQRQTRTADNNMFVRVSLIYKYSCPFSQEGEERHRMDVELRRLQRENKRLQDDLRTASHQLRKFSEWFFTSVEPSNT